jgi:RND family efflux transporter MFP subunit
MRSLSHFSVRLLLLTASAAATVLPGLAGCRRPTDESARREAPPPRVSVVVARKRDIPVVRTPNATTRALNEVTIRARVKGFLKEKHFAEGANVKKDQLLLVIDEEPFKVRVAQAGAVLAEAKAELQKAEESRAREVARAQVALAETQLQLERVEERRERTLIGRKATSQEDYDRAKARVEKTGASVQAATASLQQALADHEINILAARAKIDKAQADLREAEIELGYCRMSAPIDGRAGELQVKPGNLVGPATGGGDTTSLVTIQQLDPMGVDIRPASRYLPTINRMVKNGLEVTLRVQGQKAHPHGGKILFVDNTVDPTTSTVLLKASVPNPDETVLPGEYVKVDLNIGDYVDAIAIPEEAVVEAQEGSRVLLVGSGDKVESAVVKALDEYQGLVVLSSGVRDGDKVIVKGLQLVRPGQAVQATEVDLETFLRSDDGGDGPPDPAGSSLLRIRGSATGGDGKPGPAPEGASTAPGAAGPSPPPAAPAAPNAPGNPPPASKSAS